MKYLMGLIITVTLGASAFAQNRSSTKMKERQAKVPAASTVGARTRGSDSLIRFSNGSAEYTVSPKAIPGKTQTRKETSALIGKDLLTKEEASALSTMELAPFMDTSKVKKDKKEKEKPKPNKNKSTTSSSSDRKSYQEGTYKTNGKKSEPVGNENSKVPMPTSSVAPMIPDVGEQCALNNEFRNRQGKFKDKRQYGDGELEIKREKDGDEKVKYKSRTEDYKYNRENNGKEKFQYSVIEDNAALELVKKSDGTAEVYYQGVFNNIREAEDAISEGLTVENFGESCMSGFSNRDSDNDMNLEEESD